MVLQATGSLSLSEIQTEFGGSGSISLSEYYRNGTIIASDVEDPESIPDGPAGTTIKFSHFRGAGDFQEVEIGGIESSVNLKTKAKDAGWNESNPVRVIMKSNAVYYGGSYGAKTDTWPRTVKFTIKGKILGKGGKGGDGSHNGNAGSAGLPGLEINKTIDTLTIASGGVIAGGGGGGGSGKSPDYDDSAEDAASGGGGGAGGGKGGSACNFLGNAVHQVTAGGNGGTIFHTNGTYRGGENGKNGADRGTREGVSTSGTFGEGGSAGGGGGGFDIGRDKGNIVGGNSGSGGGGGRKYPGGTTSQSRHNTFGGGIGQSAGNQGGGTGSANDDGRSAPLAGGGGGWGAAGGAGKGASGGGAGNAIKLNGHKITNFNNNGTQNGSKS